MKKTKTLVMILLSLLLVASLFVGVACENKCKDGHTDANHDGVCDICEEEGLTVEHDWSTGTCSCGAKCPHEVKNAECACTVCGATVHTWTYDAETTLGTCSGCGAACEGHKWNEDSVCTICEYACPHTWDAEEEACLVCGIDCEHEFNETGLCAICAHQCAHAYWTLGFCDKCEMECAHEEYSYGICSACGVSIAQSEKDACTHKFEANGLCSICGAQDPATLADRKTYNLSSSSLPAMWNSLDYQSNDATTVTGYTEDSFYTFDYNKDKTGYKMVPAMALDFPVEVAITDELAAKWGFEKDANGNYPAHHIWTIELRHDLKYDNGDAINAYSFIETAKRLLDPKAANYRADSLYSGNMVIHNAENYLKQGSIVDEPAYKFFSDFANKSSEFASDIVFDIQHSYVGEYIVKEGYGTDRYLNAYGGWNGLASALFGIWSKADLDALTGKTWAEISASEELTAIWKAVITPWQTDPDEELHFFSTEYIYPEVKWENVGLYALDDYTLVFVLDKPLEGFYLHYSIGLPLVHVPTYDKCASTEGGIYTNKYGTSVETYVGYGPYKLVTHVADSILVFEKNNHWYGHSEKNEFDDTIYEATGIVIKQVVDEATRLQMFLKGELDSYALQEADMKDYQSSKYTYYTEGDSTWFVALNPDFDGLKAAQEAKTTEPVNSGYVVNKTVLTIKEFRQALSFSLNRAEYQLTLDPVGSVGKALYSGMIISDPENGVTYRSTEQAKDTILAFWGLTNDVCTDACEAGCKDHMYANKDLAIESITGYDPVGAKALFDEAYAIAVEEELIPADAIASGKWEVQIMVGQPGTGSSTYYNKGYEYLAKIWVEAVKGTKFEGHLTFKQSAPLGSSNFSDYLKNNSIDLLFGVGWTGSALDPYSLIEAYVAPNYQYDPGWDTSDTEMIVELPLTAEGVYDEENGTIVRLSGSVYDWHKTLFGDKKAMVVVNAEGQPIDKDGNVVDPENKDQVALTVEIAAGTSANATMRLIILAKIEQAVLEQYDMIPVGLDASASMKCHRLQFETEEYVFGVGRGGLKYLDFEMTDAEWAAAVKAAGGQWNYKVSE